MPRAAPTDPVFAPIIEGQEDGELCNRNGCTGRLEVEEPENCSCHINPPCAACTSVKLYCPECYWTEEDE